eukprot:1224231-Rhodomonas_salina.1
MPADGGGPVLQQPARQDPFELEAVGSERRHKRAGKVRRAARAVEACVRDRANGGRKRKREIEREENEFLDCHKAESGMSLQSEIAKDDQHQHHNHHQNHRRHHCRRARRDTHHFGQTRATASSSSSSSS